MVNKQHFLSALCMVLAMALSGRADAQDVGIKTNLLYDATTTINLGAEVGLARKWTLDISGSLNPWKFKEDKKFRVWMAQPEVRYWFCERFNGHFIGGHLLGGQFDVSNVKLPFGLAKSVRDDRVQGWYVGAGVVYGYQWVLSKHWNFEAAIGVGYAYLDWEKYKCGKCGTKLESSHSNYIGLTKAALSIVYLF